MNIQTVLIVLFGLTSGCNTSTGDVRSNSQAAIIKEEGGYVVKEELLPTVERLFFSAPITTALSQTSEALGANSLLSYKEGLERGFSGIFGKEQLYYFTKLPMLPAAELISGEISIDTISYTRYTDLFHSANSIAKLQLRDRLENSRLDMKLYVASKHHLDRLYDQLLENFPKSRLTKGAAWEDLRDRNGNMLFRSFVTPDASEPIKRVQLTKVIENVSNPSFYIYIQVFQ